VTTNTAHTLAAADLGVQLVAHQATYRAQNITTWRQRVLEVWLGYNKPVTSGRRHFDVATGIRQCAAVPTDVTRASRAAASYTVQHWQPYTRRVHGLILYSN